MDRKQMDGKQLDSPQRKSTNHDEPENSSGAQVTELRREIDGLKKVVEELTEGMKTVVDVNKEVKAEIGFLAEMMGTQNAYLRQILQRGAQVTEAQGMTKRQIIETVQRHNNTDPRVFADVKIAGRGLKGLLDTGATVCLLRRGCGQLVEQLDWPVQPYASMMTAAGASRPILRRVVQPVKYKTRVEEIVFYMWPDLQQELCPCIDFWQAFKIAPDVLGAKVSNTDISYCRDEDDEKGRIDETHFISSVEIAFWHIELEEKSRAYTAFWQIKLEEKICRVFEKANLTIGMVKSKFCFRTLNYLGYIIGGGTLRMDPGRVEGIKNIPTPRNTKELRRFLGTAEWYRRFITADGSPR
ncbi:hypothetical protein ACLKA6_001127 [Drosophila palustris]